MSPDAPRTAGDRAMGVDAVAVAVVSIAIGLGAHRLALLTVLVPVVMAARFVAWARLPRSERDGTVRAEVVFFALCTALGAFNDWSSVVRHGVYQYTVPHYVRFSTIPLWMLLFWGMVLRAMATFARWRRLGPPERRDDRVWIGRRPRRSAALRVAIELLLVLVTRQLIYRLHGDPWGSWLPFALALMAYVVILRPGRHDLRLMGAIALLGPALEVLYIQVGGLHRYALGWIGGVPLWIVLWWVLALPIWKDLSLRLHGGLEGALRDRKETVSITGGP